MAMPTLHYTVAQMPHWKLLFGALLNSFLACFPIGFQLGVLNIPGTIIQEFVNSSCHSHYGDYLDDYSLSSLWSFVVSIYSVGAVCGSLMVSPIAQRFGRRIGLFVVANVLNMAGSILMGASKVANAFELLIIGRLLIGIGVGLASGILALWLTECSPDKFRGAIGNFENFFITASSLVATIVSLPVVMGTEQLWPYLIGLALVPAIIQICLTPFFPETPKYLYLKSGDKEAAIKSILFYYGPDTNIDEIIEMFDRERELGEEHASVAAVFRQRHYRTPILLGGLAIIATMFSGILAIFNYSSDMFLAAGASEEMAQYGTPIMSAFNLLGAFIALPLISRVGRRPLLLWGLVANTICSIVFLITATIAEHTKWVSWISLAAIVCHVCIYNIGPGAVVWFLGAEMTPQSARSIAATVTVACNWGTSLLLVQVYLVLQKAIDAYSFFLFIIPSVILIILLYFWLPETKDRSLEDIQKRWRKSSETESVANGGKNLEKPNDANTTESRQNLMDRF